MDSERSDAKKRANATTEIVDEKNAENADSDVFGLSARRAPPAVDCSFRTYNPE